MMKIATILLLVWFGGNDIAKINSIKKKAEKAYKAGDFESAIESYSYLIDSLHLEDEQITMNLGNAYYKTGHLDLAQSQYQKLALSNDRDLKSLAYQQLGAISNDPKTLEKALAYFKESIKLDPSNEDARYNYELTKKNLERQKKENQQDQDKQDSENDDKKEENKDKKEDQEKGDQENDSDNKDQEKSEDQESKNQNQEGKGEQDQDQKNQDQDQDQKNQDQKDKKKQGNENQQNQKEGKEGEKKNESEQMPSPSDKMSEMNISQEKAQMILEALKNSEMQYIQQNRRKPTKTKDNNKPDW